MVPVTSASETQDAAENRRARLLALIAVGEVGVIAALVLLIAFFTALEPAFVSERNIRAILRVVSFVGIIAIGQSMLRAHSTRLARTDETPRNARPSAAIHRKGLPVV